jgi:U3 small nucleolar RNA-associated protein MPP10
MDDQVSRDLLRRRHGQFMTDVMADKEEDTAALEEEGDIEAEEFDVEEERLLVEEPTETFVPDPNGLNDGFFSIDDFNRQSEF